MNFKQNLFLIFELYIFLILYNNNNNNNNNIDRI